MPRFKQTPEILKLMRKKEAVRNVGIVAHVDHGKTTMTDSLLVEAGLLPPQVAGSARVLDYLEEEQKRGITIKTANISLLHIVDNHPYVVNLVDTPGHVDFTGKVARALRTIDGAIVVVDAVEEIMAQTETVTRQALEERVRPTLFINKVDRLVEEMKLTADDIQAKIARIIGDFNGLIETYGEQEFKDTWKVDPSRGSVAFGSALHKWGFTLEIANKKKVRFSDILKAYEDDKWQTLERLIPLHNAILNMVVKNIPNPVEAQRYRVPRIWKGELTSEVGQAMTNCNDDGPFTMSVTAAHTIPAVGLVATGRIFSGSLKEGDQIHLVEANKDCCVKQIFMYMSAFREPVNQITAGNIAALVCLDVTRAGETLVDTDHAKNMIPFEHTRYISEPVMTIAIEPKNISDLPNLADAMSKLSIEDPNIISTVNKDTGQYLLSGMGELHLEIATKSLKQYAEGIELSVSKPTVVYRESVLQQGTTVMTKSPNKKNRLWVQVEPLESGVVELMEKGELAEEMGQDEIVKIMQERTTYSTEETCGVWALDSHRNILVNFAKNLDEVNEAKDHLISGFHWACNAGPLCEEPLRGVKVKLMDAQLCDDMMDRGSTQVTRAMSRAILGSCLTAKPVLLEPICKIEVTTPTRLFGMCAKIITRRHGKIDFTENKGNLTMIRGHIPTTETFGLSSEMRSTTSGRAIWQSTFDHWKEIQEDAAANVIRQLREKRGLRAEVPEPQKFIDEI